MARLLSGEDAAVFSVIPSDAEAEGCWQIHFRQQGQALGVYGDPGPGNDILIPVAQRCQDALGHVDQGADPQVGRFRAPTLECPSASQTFPFWAVGLWDEFPPSVALPCTGGLGGWVRLLLRLTHSKRSKD